MFYIIKKQVKHINFALLKTPKLLNNLKSMSNTRNELSTVTSMPSAQYPHLNSEAFLLKLLVVYFR